MQNFLKNDDAVLNIWHCVCFSEVDDIDLYIGGLSETAVEGGVVGPTFACIIAYQFREIKMGDRLWFENGGDVATFTPGILFIFVFHWFNIYYSIIIFS